MLRKITKHLLEWKPYNKPLEPTKVTILEIFLMLNFSLATLASKFVETSPNMLMKIYHPPLYLKSYTNPLSKFSVLAWSLVLYAKSKLSNKPENPPKIPFF